METIVVGKEFTRIVKRSPNENVINVSLIRENQVGFVDIDDAVTTILSSDLLMVKIPKWYFDSVGFMGISYRNGTDGSLVEFINATITNESISPIKLPETCIVKGSLSDIMGNGPKDTEILFHVVHIPTKKNNTLITGKPFSTVPDVNGNFTVALVKGTTVMCTIPSAGIKNQFKVPDQDTANLTDLLPEISQ